MVAPVGWGDTASRSPGPGCVVSTAPLERKQLLEPDPSDSKVHKSAVYESIVAVDAKALH